MSDVTEIGKVSVRIASAIDFEPACETLAAAFFDDPFIGYMFPDPGRRARMLPVYFSIYSDGALLLIAGDHTTDYAGVSVQHTPESLDLSPERAAADNERVYATCGQDATAVVNAMNTLAANHPHHLAHFYLFFLGVRAERRGLPGHALLKHMMEMWDREGLHLYGEATTSQLARFYERRIGVKPINSPIRLDNGPELYPMMRAPRAMQRDCKSAT